MDFGEDGLPTGGVFFRIGDFRRELVGQGWFTNPERSGRKDKGRDSFCHGDAGGARGKQGRGGGAKGGRKDGRGALTAGD